MKNRLTQLLSPRKGRGDRKGLRGDRKGGDQKFRCRTLRDPSP